MAWAFVGPMTMARSSSERRLICFTLEKRNRRFCAVAGPIPGMSVSEVRKVPFERLFLWKLIANRWTSFCICSRRRKRGSVGLSWSVLMEVGGWRSEVGGWRSEVGGWRSEVGGWRSEVGGWRSEFCPPGSEF